MSSLSWFLGFLYSQFLVTPSLPTTQFTDQTVIVTGSNTGLGLEAARHITALNAAKVILAVRTISKGETAKASIEKSTGRLGVVEVWPLDLSSYDSVKKFAARASEELKRVDVLLENAGMMAEKFVRTGEDESMLKTNVVSTFLLGLLMLPKMRETARVEGVVPRLVVVSSDLHFIAKFPERKAERVFEALNEEGKTDINDRYAVTKLLEILLVRHLASVTADTRKPTIIFNTLTPGACKSDFFRENSSFAMTAMQKVIGRATEVGGRTLVAAAAAGEESHGKYMADGVVSYESPFVLSEEGRIVGEKVWDELLEKLERISPGIRANV